ncbi:MAG: hypothetical protein GVY36_13045 [Verrucomicrobia bacterium]|jgi:hypothetical protein|nr:hypothetical protein [Verrucomicrobiota bacterium]
MKQLPDLSSLRMKTPLAAHRFLGLGCSAVKLSKARGVLFAAVMAAVPLSAVTVNLPDLSVPNDATVKSTLSLPAGADFFRVSGDWSASLGNPESRDLELTVVGPGEVSGFLPVFANAEANTSPVIGLQGEFPLTSTGAAGDYRFTFENKAGGSEIAFQNGVVELLTLKEDFTDNGSIGPGSTTFERPDESGAPSGRTTRYATYQFTPSFSGPYVITSQQVGFDGFIALYDGDQTTAPFSGFITANDDSAAGESFSRLEVNLVAGQTYTLVSTSFSTVASGSFTNRIRNFAALEIDTSKATTYEDYADQRGFTGGPQADDTGNGLSNLIEYAINLNAERPFEAPIDVQIEGGIPVIRFYRDAELTDITYIIEASSDLSVWAEIYNSSTDLQPNADGAHQEIEDNAAGAGGRFYRLRVKFNGPSKATTYEDYAAQRGFTGGPQADDTGNSLSNLLEYALGRDADSPFEAPLEVRIEDGTPVVRFYRDPELSDITYIIEASSDLSDWSEIYNSAIDLQANADGAFQEIEDNAAGADGRFYRLLVVLDTSGKATTYEDYADQRGFSGGPDADDTGNGLSNLLEYALGRDADSPFEAPLEVRIEDGTPVVRFYRDPELSDITYIIEASSDLSGWSEIYNSAINLQANADGAFQEIEDNAAGANNRFYRLLVVLDAD